jgi:hypothetical protein
MALACVLCLMGLLLAHTMLVKQKGHTQRVELAMGHAHSQLAVGVLPVTDIQSLPASTDPAQWPLRMDADDVVRQAGEIAQSHYVSLRTLSVAHQIPSTQTWGQVTLDASASGSYVALKAWQAAMQQRFPALSVRSLRVQGQPLNAGGLDAQVIWVLHVRD